MLGELILKPFEIILNKLLHSDECFFPKLKPFVGTCFRLQSKDNWWQFDCVIKEDAIYVYPDAGAEPDITILLTPQFIKEWLCDPKNPTVFFSDAYEIRGDIEKVDELKKVFSTLEIEGEELLSGVVGDAAANHIAYAAKQTKECFSELRTNTKSQLRDYLEEETEILTPQVLVKEFVDDTITLRDDVERLTARIDKLSKARNPQQSSNTKQKEDKV